MSIGLPIWVVYDHPTDFPESYIARLWDGMTNTATASYLLAPTLDALRARLPPELVQLARHEEDDPAIVETWL